MELTRHLRFAYPTRLLALASLVFAIAATSACEKKSLVDEQDARQTQISEPKIIDGRVSFVDMAQLASFMEKYDANDQSTYGPLTGFSSYRKVVAQAFNEIEMHINQGATAEEISVQDPLYVNAASNEVRPNVPDGFLQAS